MSTGWFAPHILWKHNRQLCDGRECVKCSLSYGRPPQLWRSGSYLDSCAAHVDAFTTLSESCAARHREFGFSYPMQVLQPFLSAAPEDEGGGELPTATRPYCLFAGRLEETKGLQDVIPLFDDNSPAELWIAGAGAYEPELRKLAQGRKTVRFLGYQRFANLRRLYRGARVVVMPSLCYEVFPMVVLEAFREGVPVIARARGPFPEILTSSQGGLLFETQQELRGALDLALHDNDVRERLSNNARNAFEQNWTEEAGLNRYFAFIEQLAQKRGKHTLAGVAQEAVTA
ncbi:MAG: glycosyltransferase family 4 protein [Bryobacterales bacterium]